MVFQQNFSVRKTKASTFFDFVGPLGVPTETEGFKKVAVIGGGVGNAIAFPQAKSLFKAGCQVDVISGFRTKDLYHS